MTDLQEQKASAKQELVDMRDRVLRGEEPSVEETRHAIELLQIIRGKDLEGSSLNEKAKKAKATPIDLGSLFS